MTTVSPDTAPPPRPQGSGRHREDRAPPPPPAMRLRELVFGAACAAAVRAAARLGVADALGDTPATVEDLAAAVKTEPQPLRRLLRALSCYGVFAETAGRDVRPHRHVPAAARGRSAQPARTSPCGAPSRGPGTPGRGSTRRCAPAATSSRTCTARGSSTTCTRTRPSRPHVFNRAMTTSSMQSALDVAELLDLTGVSRRSPTSAAARGMCWRACWRSTRRLRGTLLDLPRRGGEGGPAAA